MKKVYLSTNGVTGYSAIIKCDELEIEEEQREEKETHFEISFYLKGLYIGTVYCDEYEVKDM